MKVSTVLRRAGDISRERGWWRRDFEGPNGEVCALGAVRIQRLRLTKFWIWYIGPLQTVTGYGQVGDWNDAPGRTHDEVLIALDAAYVLALQDEGADPVDLAERGEL